MYLFDEFFTSAADLEQFIPHLEKRMAPDQLIRFKKVPEFPEEEISVAGIFSWPSPIGLTMDNMQMISDMMRREPGVFLGKAATGLGKSTRLPFLLYALGWSVLVVQPSHLLAVSCYAFVAPNRPEAKFGLPTPSKAVYYASVTDVLIHIVNGERFHGALLYLDEAHTLKAEYSALLAWIRIHQATSPVLFTSATVGEDRSGPREPGKEIKVVEIQGVGTSPMDFKAVCTNGAYSAQHVTLPTMTFAPDNRAVKMVAEVYESWGVPYITFSDGDGVEQFKKIQKFLSTRTPRVLVTTDTLATGVTLPVDCVFDFGVSVTYVAQGTPIKFQEVHVDTDPRLRNQKIGRTGRLRSGTAVIVKRPVKHQPFEINLMEKYRLVCWLALLGLRPNPVLSAETALLGRVTPTMAVFMLSVPTHPLLLRGFFGRDGYCYDNFKSVYVTLTGLRPQVSNKWFEVETTGWVIDEKYKVKTPVATGSIDASLIASIAHAVLNVTYNRPVSIADPADIYEYQSLLENFEFPKIEEEPRPGPSVTVSTIRQVPVRRDSVQSVQSIRTSQEISRRPAQRTRSDRFPPRSVSRVVEIPPVEPIEVLLQRSSRIVPINSRGFEIYRPRHSDYVLLYDRQSNPDPLQRMMFIYDFCYAWNKLLDDFIESRRMLVEGTGMLLRLLQPGRFSQQRLLTRRSVLYATAVAQGISFNEIRFLTSRQ